MTNNFSTTSPITIRLAAMPVVFSLIACLGPLCAIADPPSEPPPLRLKIEATSLPPELLTPVQETFDLTLTPAYLQPTAAPILTPSPTLSPTAILNDPLEPAATLLPTPSPVEAVATPAGQPPVDAGGNIYTGPLTHTVSLLDPAHEYVLPVGLDQLEFKWRYTGSAPRVCDLEAGYGFEVRVWPHPTNPYLPLPAREQLSPLGVVDAKAAQPAIAASCDPQTGNRRYLLTGLTGAPGIALANGQGQFFWDVAYVQLEPYYLVLGVASPHTFFIPATGPTPTLGSTPTPAPAFPLTPQPRPEGHVVLLKPDHGAVFPISAGPLQFEWQWEGSREEICRAASGYGFELRIWSRQPDFIPLGLWDAVADQDRVHCDPATGVFNAIVPDLKSAPGVAATYQGELRWNGQFWWDVALVSVQPYLPPESASEPRPFDLSLGGYAGPVDQLGRALRCSEFGTWPEAQAFFLAMGGPGQDPNDLDPDADGWACEELIQ